MQSKAIYFLPVWDTVSTSWEKVKGAKESIWAGALLTICIAIAIGILAAIGKNIHPIVGSFFNFIYAFVNFFLQLGFIYIGIRRAADLPISYKQIFRPFKLSILSNLILLYIIKFLIYLPFIILMATGMFLNQSFIIFSIGSLISLLAYIGLIYLSVRLLLSAYFILDKGDLSPFDALKLSYNATRGNFWRIIGVLLCQIGILILGLITLGIGLIWFIPLILIITGTLYRRLQANIPDKLLTNV